MRDQSCRLRTDSVYFWRRKALFLTLRDEFRYVVFNGIGEVHKDIEKRSLIGWDDNLL